LSGDVGYGEGYGETESLPFFENYYAGGPRSVRGFVANSLGPREIDDDDPVGGNFRMVGSLELFAPAPGGPQLSKTCDSVPSWTSATSGRPTARSHRAHGFRYRGSALFGGCLGNLAVADRCSVDQSGGSAQRRRG
jgi:outer membrane protein assembly factor BamA